MGITASNGSRRWFSEKHRNRAPLPRWPALPVIASCCAGRESLTAACAIKRGLLAVGLALLWSCQAVGPPEPSRSDVSSPRLVLLYGTCTVNKSYLSPYRSDVPFTPHLQRFADESVVFTNHRTEAGHSGPAFASIFSSSQVDRHAVYWHPTPLSDDLYLITEAYADRGYETFFWNEHGLASAKLNYGQGVPEANTFSEEPEPAYLTADDDRFQEILARLRANPGYKAFVLTNFSVTHGKYDPKSLPPFLRDFPAERDALTDDDIARFDKIYRGEHHQGLKYSFPGTIKRLGLSPDEVDQLAAVVELLYKANVYRLDGLFGDVVQEIDKHGLHDTSLIVFTADHGELLYREDAHFPFSHGMQLAPEVLNVPFILRTASVKPGVYDGVTRSIDVFPTMTGLSGFAVPAHHGLQGVDLGPALLGQRRPPGLDAFSHTPLLGTLVRERMADRSQWNHWTQLRKQYPRRDPTLMWVAVQSGDSVYKLLPDATGGWRLRVFDTKTDPSETRDLYDADEATHAEMAARLRRYKAHLVARLRADEAVLEERSLPREAEAEALKALGYIQ